MTDRRALQPALVAFVLVVCAAGAAGASDPSLRASACSVENAATGRTSGSVPDAVRAARSGATLLISGTCAGRVAISNMRLRLRGVPTGGQPIPILDAEGMARVLTVRGAHVVVRDLTLTGGHATWGGGAAVSGSYRNRHAALSLRGNTLITGNWARSGGGGVDVEQGSALKLFGSSAISGNETTWYGGGIGGRGTVVLHDSSSIADNVAEVGGGIALNEPGAVLLGDQASVSGNAASKHGGGIVNYYGTVILDDRAAVTSNTATRTGGGIRNWGSPKNRGRIYVCSDRVAIRPNDPDDPPAVRHVCDEAVPATRQA